MPGDDPKAPEPSMSVGGQRRRLMAVMFTDIKGFTALMESDEATAIGLVKAQREIIRRHIALCEGEERETIGDAFLVVFASAVNAVRCAIDIQRDLWEFNQTRDPDKQVWVRVGLHLGDIIIEEGSIFGEGVNLAARVQALAEPGGVCITRQLYDQVKHHLEIKISHLGVRELKNVTDVPDIYRIRLATTAPREPRSFREQLSELVYTPLRKVLLAGAVLLVLSANAWWTFLMPHRTYARQVAFLHHAPVARHAISAREASALDHFFILTRRGQRIVRLEEVTKPDLLPESAQEAWEFAYARRPKRDWPIHEYVYDGARLKEEHLFDRWGVLQLKLLYDEGGRAATIHDRTGFVRTLENQIAGFGFELDEKGRFARIENRNAFGMPRNDATGVASYRFAYSEDDLPTETSTFDAHGNAVENKDGVAKVALEYTPDGLVAKEVSFDRYGAVRESIGGVAMTTRTFDDLGRPVLERYADRSGEPSLDKEGACGRRFGYDGSGHRIEAVSLSCAGSPKATRKAYAALRHTYDGDRIVQEAYFDEEGNPTADSHGVGSIHISYSADGRIAELAFFGPDGAGVLGEDRAHAIRYAYDAWGHPERRTFVGPDGKPAIAESGYAEVRVRYDDRGDAIEWATFDTEGNLINRREGYAVTRNEYDPFGNLVSRAFFDRAMEPAMGREDACHRIQMKYDENGDVQEKRCFDGKGALTPGIKNCAINTFAHDSYGKLTRFECSIDEGVLIDAPNLPSILTVKYDRRGYIAEVRAFDAAGQPAERYQGAAIWRRVSDDYGNEKEIATYDRNGKLIDNPKFKAAIFRRDFDSRGNELRVQAFDANERPVVGIWGFAEVRSTYDSQSHKTSEAYFNERGQPTSDGQGVHEYRTNYDENGRVARIEHIGADGGRLAADASGVAAVLSRYDRWGQLVRTDFLDVEEKPVRNRKLGAASQEFINDERGNVTLIKNLDVDGEPCREKGCVAATVQEYDAKGMMLKQLFRDADGNPALDEEGASGYAFEYDLQGRKALLHVMGPDGGDGADAAGVHAYRLAYRPDQDKAIWYLTFEGTDGKPARSKAGADLRIVFYDPVYGERQRARVDVAPSGQAVVVKCLDEAGMETHQTTCITPQEIKNEFAKIKPRLSAN